MSEGMIAVRLLACHLKPNKCDHGRTGIGKVVKGIGCDGDGAADIAGKCLPDKQKDVQHDSHRSAEHAVCLAYLRVCCIFIVFYQKSRKKCYHIISSPLFPYFLIF